MFQLLSQGGLVVYALLALSITGVYIVAQKWLFLSTNAIKDPVIINKIATNISQSGIENTTKTLTNDSRLMSKLLGQLLQASQTENASEEIDQLMQRENTTLEKNLDILANIITVAPILGLLGTVIGLMDIFNVISGGGLGDAQALSAGIAKALITTVMGLSIAIPFIFLDQLLNRKINQFVATTQTHLNRILDSMNGSKTHITNPDATIHYTTESTFKQPTL